MMADTVVAFPARIPITIDGQLASRAFIDFLAAMVFRVGGVVAPTIGELDAQQYADAGIEESKAQLFALADEMAVKPQPNEQPTIEVLINEVHALREAVANLANKLNDIQQGTQI